MAAAAPVEEGSEVTAVMTCEVNAGFSFGMLASVQPWATRERVCSTTRPVLRPFSPG